MAEPGVPRILNPRQLILYVCESMPYITTRSYYATAAITAYQTSIHLNLSVAVQNQAFSR